MYTLLLRLTGPMQAWGTQSRFDRRDTQLEPSKSAVIGLVCAACGIDRGNWEHIKPLARMQMGVRVDQEGSIQCDFHTAQDLTTATPRKGPKTSVTRRYYIADACYLVGLSSRRKGLLEQVQAALRDPHWALYLGRKSFPPSRPVWLPDGLQEKDLETSLLGYPFLCDGNPPGLLRFVVESRN